MCFGFKGSWKGNEELKKTEVTMEIKQELSLLVKNIP